MTHHVEAESMETTSEHRHQVMDWRAAFAAGLVSGATTLIVLLIGYPLITGGTPWNVLRYMASIVLGNAILPPPTTFNVLALVTGVVVFRIQRRDQFRGRLHAEKTEGGAPSV